MADHLHKQIRAALVTALTGLTTSATRVYANRLQPMIDESPRLRAVIGPADGRNQVTRAPFSPLAGLPTGLPAQRAAKWLTGSVPS